MQLFSEYQSEEASCESGWLSLMVGMSRCTCGSTVWMCKHLISLLLLESDLPEFSFSVHCKETTKTMMHMKFGLS